MPFYQQLTDGTDESRRTASGLLRLKAALNESVPARTVGEDLLLATWNIREFESGKYGPRAIEPIFYLAEIISRFDLVAVQEVRDDLSSFNKLIGLLGGGWRYLLSDVTEGTGGNRERMAFLYDSRKIDFTGLAGEMVIPKKKAAAVEQVARTPYLVEFKAGWLRFLLCTVHIYYGTKSANDPKRVGEIRDVAKFIANRANSDFPDSPNTVLLGDFNIFATTDETMKGITAAGFTIPEQVLELNTDLAGRYHYDQIATLGRDLDTTATARAGTLAVFDHVYRDEDEATYRKAMGEAYAKKKNGVARTEAEKRTYYRAWRTFQVSDHQPLWVQLPIDHSSRYLERIGGPAPAPAARPAAAGRTRARPPAPVPAPGPAPAIMARELLEEPAAPLL